MIITDVSTLDITKYKRFFVFGCSFTQYRWPTWADILHYDMSEGTEYYNTATSGAGNFYIFSQLSQCVNKYDLTDTDLVAIMWTNFYREDRYIKGRHNNWMTPGNLYSQDQYKKSFVDEMCCERGMSIRDISLIDASQRILQNEKCDTIMTSGIGLQEQSVYTGIDPDQETDLTDVWAIYTDIQSNMLPSVYELEYPNGWITEYSYKHPDAEEEFGDYHPSVMGYKQYLEKLGFTLSNKTKQWVGEEHIRMLNVKHKDEISESEPRLIL